MAVNVLRGRDPETGDGLEVERSGRVITSIRRFVIEPGLRLPWISVGLIDLQVNGYRGFDVNDEDLSAETVAGLEAALRAVGTTTFVPTIITNTRERMLHAVETVAAARASDPRIAAAIPYIHLEGPYISAEDGPRGCHDAHYVRAPDPEEFERWQSASRQLIGMVTVSPHWPESVPFIASLRSAGVRVSIGHTHATPEQIHAAVDAGAEFSTHLGNGAHAVLPRHPNYLWAQLADTRLRAGFVADGHHLSADTFAAMLRAKGLERSFLVSDVAGIGGMPPGRYSASVGGDVEVTGDGRLLSYGTPLLAGAVANLGEGVARSTSMAALSLADALRLATLNPARAIGLGDGQGRPAVGASTDLITFDWMPGEHALSNIHVAGESP